jgi:hypothetical protein
MLLDLHKNGLVSEILDDTALTAYAQENALSDSHWLLSYEAGRRDWLRLGNTSFIDNHKFFGSLKTAGVVFYDENKHSHPIFDFKAPPKISEEFDFDNDDVIEGKFEFDEMDDEYFDKACGSEWSEDDVDSETEGSEISLEDLEFPIE